MLFRDMHKTIQKSKEIKHATKSQYLSYHFDVIIKTHSEKKKNRFSFRGIKKLCDSDIRKQKRTKSENVCQT